MSSAGGRVAAPQSSAKEGSMRVRPSRILLLSVFAVALAPAAPAQPREPLRLAQTTGAVPPAGEQEDKGASPAAPRRGRHAAAAPTQAIGCSGAFARGSNHTNLAAAFGEQNVVFTDVDGPDGALKASVLYPTDPKRRLEVLWQNETARADTSLIVINGHSTWTAPKGLRLGLPLAALEKLNGRPFTLAGFDQPNGGTVIDWQGGALAALPGGCSVGIHLVLDPKATPAARTAAAGKELKSNDRALRAVKATVGEIILGYQQQQ
jgi:hypothetical protein